MDYDVTVNADMIISFTWCVMTDFFKYLILVRLAEFEKANIMKLILFHMAAGNPKYSLSESSPTFDFTDNTPFFVQMYETWA